jgi:RHS repeat-associated protein
MTRLDPHVFLAGTLVIAACGQGAAPRAVEPSARATTRIVYYHPAVAAGPSVITRGDGTVLDERRAEPFGAAIDGSYELDPHNVLNQETDVATGWSDHGARWLAPDTARWLTPDPPVKAPDPSFMGRPWALHPYQYVEQNPIASWDPDGRDKKGIDGIDGAFQVTIGADQVVNESKKFGPLEVNVKAVGFETKTSNLGVESELYVCKISTSGQLGEGDGVFDTARYRVETTAGASTFHVGIDGVHAEVVAVEKKLEYEWGPFTVGIGFVAGVGGGAHWGDKIGLSYKGGLALEFEVDPSKIPMPPAPSAEDVARTANMATNGSPGLGRVEQERLQAMGL